jgi:hypothetical protein
VWHIASGQYGTDVTLTVDGEALTLDNAMVVHVQNNQVRARCTSAPRPGLS